MRKLRLSIFILAIVMLFTLVSCKKKTNDDGTGSQTQNPEPKQTYTVTIDGAEQVVEEGQTVTEPKDPEKEGYKFLGWYVGDTLFDFDTIIDNNFKEYEDQDVKSSMLSVDEINFLVNVKVMKDNEIL